MNERDGRTLLRGLIIVLALLVIAQIVVVIALNDSERTESDNAILNDAFSTGTLSAAFLAVIAVIAMYVKMD